jgi:hypothetical protein
MENTPDDSGCLTHGEFSTLPATGNGSYAKFDRCLKDLLTYKKAASSDGPHWFKDLLSLWRPSGHPSDADGLRLAVRNGYLSFYRLGQSIARVECASGELVADVHYKYVLGDQPGYAGPVYLRLSTQGIFSRDPLVPAYGGIDTLRKWIACVNEKYAGDEKSIVDQLVEANDHVIDLEMALPAWTVPKVAVRMDLVAIEDRQVVFWEVKTVNDSRIRCRAEFTKDKFPEVLDQLSKYRDYLTQPLHVQQVERAYRETAVLLVKLRAMADAICPTPLALGSSIIAASKVERLAVAPVAALVVVDLPEDKKQSWNSWKLSHESKLQGRIPMRVMESAGPLVFEGAL